MRPHAPASLTLLIALALVVPLPAVLARDVAAAVPALGPDGRLEAEAFTSKGPFCDAAPAVVDDATASGGRVVAMPSSWCDLLFEDLVLPADGLFPSVRLVLPDGGTFASVSVHLGGRIVAYGSVWTSAGGAHDVALTHIAPALAGEHDLRLDIFTFGDSLPAVDFLQGHFQGADGCTNAAPTQPRIVADGFGDGTFGWTGREYVLSITGGIDADGDPVAYAWTVGDLAGTAATLPIVAATQPTVLLPTLTLRDDPSARCPDGPAFAWRADARFDVVRPPVLALTSPSPDAHCVNGLALPTDAAAGPSLLVGACDLAATLERAGIPASALGPTRFVIHGETAATAKGDAPRATYTATRVGPATVLACIEAVGDKHGVVACGAPVDVHEVGAGA